MRNSGGEADRRHSVLGDAPVLNYERAALARAAYGRTSTPADEVRAADAARELHELELREAAEQQALQRAARDAADARERRAHSIRSRVARVTGTLVVLALIATGAAMWLAPPRDDRPFVDTMELGHREVAPLPARVPARAVTTGSAASAERWFDAVQTDTDRLYELLPAFIDSSTTRLVPTDEPGWRVWVAKDVDASLCLIVHEASTPEAVAACATPDDFTASGVLVSSVGSTSISAFWDGFDVRTGQNGASLAP
ncbi:hypothetical protein [Agreia sp.]|uniref:hypothetical protein n=1 Tax=Agreia sp. TaxID=1872416 RepID=UPI0035BC684E